MFIIPVCAFISTEGAIVIMEDALVVRVTLVMLVGTSVRWAGMLQGGRDHDYGDHYHHSEIALMIGVTLVMIPVSMLIVVVGMLGIKRRACS